MFKEKLNDQEWSNSKRKMSRNDRVMSQFERLESKNKRNSKIMNFRLGIGKGQYLRAFPKHEGENLHTSIILEMNNPLHLNESECKSDRLN